MARIMQAFLISIPGLLATSAIKVACQMSSCTPLDDEVSLLQQHLELGSTLRSSSTHSNAADGDDDDDDDAEKPENAVCANEKGLEFVPEERIRNPGDLTYEPSYLEWCYWIAPFNFTDFPKLPPATEGVKPPATNEDVTIIEWTAPKELMGKIARLDPLHRGAVSHAALWLGPIGEDRTLVEKCLRRAMAADCKLTAIRQIFEDIPAPVLHQEQINFAGELKAAAWRQDAPADQVAKWGAVFRKFKDHIAEFLSLPSKLLPQLREYTGTGPVTRTHRGTGRIQVIDQPECGAGEPVPELTQHDNRNIQVLTRLSEGGEAGDPPPPNDQELKEYTDAYDHALALKRRVQDYHAGEVARWKDLPDKLRRLKKQHIDSYVSFWPADSESIQSARGGDGRAEGHARPAIPQSFIKDVEEEGSLFELKEGRLPKIVTSLPRGLLNVDDPKYGMRAQWVHFMEQMDDELWLQWNDQNLKHATYHILQYKGSTNCAGALFRLLKMGLLGEEGNGGNPVLVQRLGQKSSEAIFKPSGKLITTPTPADVTKAGLKLLPLLIQDSAQCKSRVTPMMTNSFASPAIHMAQQCNSCMVQGGKSDVKDCSYCARYNNGQFEAICTSHPLGENRKHFESGGARCPQKDGWQVARGDADCATGSPFWQEVK